MSEGPIRILVSQLEHLQSVSADGLPAGSSFEPAQPLAERRGTQKLGESSPLAHTGPEQ
jgi:hypothetical protein